VYDDEKVKRKDHKGFSIDNFNIYTKQTKFEGLDAKIIAALDRAYISRILLLNSTIITPTEKIIFKRFIVAYYNALAKLLIEQRFKEFDENSATNKPISDFKH